MSVVRLDVLRLLTNFRSWLYTSEVTVSNSGTSTVYFYLQCSSKSKFSSAYQAKLVILVALMKHLDHSFEENWI